MKELQAGVELLLELQEIFQEELIDFKAIQLAAANRMPALKTEAASFLSEQDIISTVRDNPSSLIANRFISFWAKMKLDDIVEKELLAQADAVALQKYLNRLKQKYAKKDEAHLKKKAKLILEVRGQQVRLLLEELLEQMEKFFQERLEVLEAELTRLDADIATLDEDIRLLQEESASIKQTLSEAVQSMNDFDRGFFRTNLEELLGKLPPEATADLRKFRTQLWAIHELLDKDKGELSFEERRIIRQDRRILKAVILDKVEDHLFNQIKSFIGDDDRAQADRIEEEFKALSKLRELEVGQDFRKMSPEEAKDALDAMHRRIEHLENLLELVPEDHQEEAQALIEQYKTLLERTKEQAEIYDAQLESVRTRHEHCQSLLTSKQKEMSQKRADREICCQRIAEIRECMKAIRRETRQENNPNPMGLQQAMQAQLNQKRALEALSSPQSSSTQDVGSLTESVRGMIDEAPLNKLDKIYLRGVTEEIVVSLQAQDGPLDMESIQTGIIRTLKADHQACLLDCEDTCCGIRDVATPSAPTQQAH